MKKVKSKTAYRVGDAVRTAGPLKFKFCPMLPKGEAMRVVAVEDGGATVKCTLLDDAFVTYALAPEQIERIGRVFYCAVSETRTKYVHVAASSEKEAKQKLRGMNGHLTDCDLTEFRHKILPFGTAR